MTAQPLAKEIFQSAIEITQSAQRDAFVTGACRGDEVLFQKVVELLEAHFEKDSWLDPRRARAPHESPMTESLEQPERLANVSVGTQIGNYKLLEQIGVGGMGIVFMAEQLKPIRRKVALKIIKPGMDTSQVIARFEAERQALALMDHPNIAHVLDAGATDSGRPYFVMELVRGIPITEYCDKNRLDTPERLKLFAKVCQAVQHAHNKGIIHRDIKPSNVLVTLHDGTPVPKIIDFGVAKATNQQLTDRTLFTSFAQFVGTPLYMSPEQAEMSGLDVDTRSDIYSLGVLLYELLTGTTPFDRVRLHQAALDEIRRIIREEEPPRPSTRVSSLGDASVTTSMQRSTDPLKLKQLLKRELDWIVMKTLEKDRTRRYETVNQLAIEVQRYLDGEPVEACPPSTTYRLSKLVSRHRTAFVIAASFLLLILGSTVFSLAQYARASRARDQALAAQDDAQRERDRALEAEKTAAKHLDAATQEKVRADNHARELKQRLYDFTIIKANTAYRDRDMSNVATLLSECLPEQRGWEWSFLNRQTSGPRSLKLPGIMNWEFAISPDMTRVVVIDDGGVVRCLALSDGSLLWSKKSEVLISSGCCISPDGQQFIVTGSRQTPEATDSAKQLSKCAMESFSMANGDVLWTEKPKGITSFQPFFCLAGTKFLVTVAMSDTSSEVQLRSTADASLIWATPALSIASAIMNQAGTKIFIAEAQEMAHEHPSSLRCLSADDRKQLWKVDRPKEGSNLLLSPDESELIATGQNMDLILYDANTGKLKQRYKGPLNEAGVMVFSCNPRSHVLTVTPAGNIAVWNWQTKSSLETLKAASAFAAQLTHDGSQLAYLVGQANTLQLRPVRSTLDTLTLVGHQSGYKGARFLDPQHLCSVGPDRAWRVWQTTTGQELMAKTTQATGLELTVAPDASWIAAATMQGTKVWDKATGNLLQDWPQDGPSWFVKRNATGTLLATAGEQGIVRVYETKNNVGPGQWSTKVASPSHEFKASGSIHGLAVSADGQTLATLDTPGCEVILWDVPSGNREVLRTAQPGQMGRTIELSPDGRLLAIGVSQTVELWDLPSRKLITTFRDAGVKVMSLTFDKTGSRLFAGTVNGMIVLWNLQSRERLLSFKAHNNFVVCLDMSPDNATLASSGLDGELRLWETQLLSPELAAQRDLVQRATKVANRLLVQHRTPKAALQHLLQTDSSPSELTPAVMANLQARMEAPINLNALAAATDAKPETAIPRSAATVSPPPTSSAKSTANTANTVDTANTADANRTMSASGLKTRIDATLSKSMADILQPTTAEPSLLISERWNTLCRSQVQKSTYNLEPAQLIALLQQIKDNGDAPHYILYLKAIAHLQIAQWEMAETEMSSALALIPIKSPLWFTYAFRLSFLQAYVGKWDENRKLCNAAIESYKDTKDSIILERLAKMCLFSKQASIDMPTAAAIADRAHSENEYLGGRVYARMTLGLALLWQKKYAEAIEHFDYVISTGIPGDKPGQDIITALSKLYLAIAYHHVNRHTEAKQQFDEASLVIESFPPTSGWWPDWMMACVVQKEVRALLP